jgi:GntR family transcriptional repressor for pyruvate dehydrogenase complex
MTRKTEGSTEQVLSHVRALIDSGQLKPGNRLLAERDLALQIGVSRSTVRIGLRALAAMGVVRSRHGSGTYVESGPPTLGCAPLSFLAALHGFTREEMYEARRVLEVGAAGLAAERATPDQLANMAEEVANLFGAMDDPHGFLVHDIGFHRSVAAASGNQIVAAVMQMVSELYYEQRRETATLASNRNLHDAAEMHHRIYQAIRDRDPQAARTAMNDHLQLSAAHQAREPGNVDTTDVASADAARPTRRRRSAGRASGPRRQPGGS